MDVNIVFKEAHIRIPYEPVQRPEGHDNYGYVDLKREPEKIDSIPELADSPELKELVRELNHPRSLFRSVGCEKSAVGPVVMHDGVPFRRNSYVDVVFEILEWNNQKNYEHLCREL